MRAKTRIPAHEMAPALLKRAGGILHVHRGSLAKLKPTNYAIPADKLEHIE